MIAGQVGDTPVPQRDQVLGGFPAGQDIVVVHIDSLIGISESLSHQHIEKPLVEQIADNRILLPGVEDNKALRHAVFRHGFDGFQDLLLVLSGDYSIDILLLIAQKADAPDDLQEERVFISLTLRRREDDSDGSGVLGGQAAGLKIWLIAQDIHGLPHLFLCLEADGRMIPAGPGSGIFPEDYRGGSSH